MELKALNRNISTLPALLEAMRATVQGRPETWEPVYLSTRLKIVCIPTTLSSGEFSLPIAGGVDPDTLHKQLVYDHTSPGPLVIVWDPTLTTTTPLRTWLSTGLRAIDHCVECYTAGPRANVDTSKAAVRAIRLLAPALLRTLRKPCDLEARLQSQLGGMYAVQGIFLHSGSVGASHGIGHQLGPLGVAHGDTSAILMPAVAEFNRAAVEAQQEQLVREVFWTETEVAEALEHAGLRRGSVNLSQVLDTYIRILGLPRTLEEVGIGKDMHWQIAESSVQDRCCMRNPIPLTDPSMVVQILDLVSKAGR